ncbi:Ig-like domain repeat protein [Bradyrhizobium sp. SYSU BS000235]|uniref:Ig-like domain repeat protein n=1 Tax=Bradyrhizobium sp. SYSU BS000235 TaxID=3411332 RepID=UPI003C771957
MAFIFATVLFGLVGGTGAASAQSLSVISVKNPGTVGDNVELIATDTGGVVPIGQQLQFLDGATVLGGVFVSGGSAALSVSTFTAGTHNITVSFGGVTSPVLVQVVLPATTTSLVSSPNPSAPNQPVTLTATVTGASPTGTVEFFESATSLGTGTVSGGQASLVVPSLALGSHFIHALYSGDSNNGSSISPTVTQDVSVATTTTTVGSSPNPSASGQSVIFTVTVTGSSPTGTVQFKDGGSNLGAAVTLTAVSATVATATFTTSALTTTSHNITAVYSGDTNNGTSTSSALTQTVNAAATTTTVGSSPNPSTLGQSVTLTATVTGGNSPTGTVQFKDNGSNLGAAVNLAGGVATLATSALTSGSHSITAVYSGDTNNATSTSSALTQNVNGAASSTGLTSSLNPSALGQSVTFTATVTGTSPTGTVQFKDGASNLGAAVTLTGGTATFTTSALTTGGHSITAVYSGDANNGTSTSSALTQTVNQSGTTTSVVSSVNPSAPGQSVTFTATVTGASPTGTVQFKDGASNLGAAVALAGGTATFTTSALASGGHAITAVYSGDGNNATSTSTALTQSVNLLATTTAVSSSANPSKIGESVTFTATVSSGGGTPTGTVTFKDGDVAIGSVALAGGGVATFTISSLTTGSHSITAVYGGSASFNTSTSAALNQTVGAPADSLKLRAMQALAAPVVAQNSGAAISGAVDAAISEGFGGGGALVTPSGSGVRFNFAADPDSQPADSAPRSTDPFSSANGSFTSTGRGFAAQPSTGNTDSATSRVNDAFGALAYAALTKAPPRYVQQRDWLGWAEVRFSVLNNWGAGTGAVGTVAGASMLYGSQVNMIAGLTRRVTPNFLVGVLGGYETFDYRSDALRGHLTGNGWTVGSYLGWKLTDTIRFDAAVAYSGIGYDGTAGTASGNFGGERWMVSSGLTGTYRGFGLQIEPSARVYALWERENAYTDSLGTLQTERNFSTGRASGGLKVAYPIAWSSTIAIAPYLGLYGDYYFNSDNALAAAAVSGLPGAVVLDGFSARAIGGVTAKFADGGQLALGTEFSGIGGNASIWIYRARASVPF